jgi:hypothetical protein
MAGAAGLDQVEGDGFDTQSLRQISSLSHSRQPQKQAFMNKTG